VWEGPVLPEEVGRRALPPYIRLTLYCSLSRPLLDYAGTLAALSLRLRSNSTLSGRSSFISFSRLIPSHLCLNPNPFPSLLPALPRRSTSTAPLPARHPFPSPLPWLVRRAVVSSAVVLSPPFSDLLGLFPRSRSDVLALALVFMLGQAIRPCFLPARRTW
jgi:hypothetical protein